MPEPGLYPHESLKPPKKRVFRKSCGQRVGGVVPIDAGLGLTSLPYAGPPAAGALSGLDAGPLLRRLFLRPVSGKARFGLVPSSFDP